LLLVKAGGGGHSGRLIFAELKSQRGNLKPDQARWLNALQSLNDDVICVDGRDEWSAPNVMTVVWRPAQWSDGTIEAILKGEPS